MTREKLYYTKEALKGVGLKVGAKKKADRKYIEEQTVYNTALLLLGGELDFKMQIEIIKNN